MNIELKVDYGNNVDVWGIIEVNDNMIIENAATLPELMEAMKFLASEIEGVEITGFNVVDITEQEQTKLVP